jgi:hypothetical protein
MNPQTLDSLTLMMKKKTPKHFHQAKKSRKLLVSLEEQSNTKRMKKALSYIIFTKT